MKLIENSVQQMGLVFLSSFTSQHVAEMPALRKGYEFGGRYAPCLHHNDGFLGTTKRIISCSMLLDKNADLFLTVLNEK